ncbi:hypothetical protein AAFF_G00381310 [Aldrovandia affinis]|uniref:C2 domain-containing protein n=1 Tax=Aldrovandia affinis TaxID=143900 RepID=A0AAD7T809_9TELE|nr:hypothetical protein AAFF_G00381310 [Aldrovandia affinis]
MAVPVGAVAGGVAAGVFFLLLTGAAAYFLFKRRRVQMPYQELFPCTPTVPVCTCPILLTAPSTSYRRVSDSSSPVLPQLVLPPGDIPFFIPPSHRTRPHVSVEEEEEEEEGHPGLHDHRGSLSIGASFPLGSLRPDLYRIPEELGEWAPPCGSTPRLRFSAQYRPEREELLVSPLQAANLPSHCRSSATLVKLQLLPDDRRRRQAKARRKGRNPQFNDSFVFQVLCEGRSEQGSGQVSSDSLAQATLCLSVFSVDRLKKHQLEGRVLFPLRELELGEAEGRVVWRDLESDNSQSGQVILQLHTQVVKSKKTAVVRGGANPTFNERLTFRLRPPQLDESCLCLELLQTIPGDPRSLGQVVIGPFMYARGRELDHWNDMVSKPQELVKQWHSLGRIPENQAPP